MELAVPSVHAAPAPPDNAVSDVDRLKLIFDTNDGLQELFAHHLDGIQRAAIEALRLHAVAPGEEVVRQGEASGTLFVVEDGYFDVLVQPPTADGRGFGPPTKVCEYGPGSIFGEQALLSSKPRPRAASVVAATSGHLWTLQRETFSTITRAPEGTKSIGLLGGVMLLINNLAGPTIVSMPALAQEAGWLSLALVLTVVAGLSVLSGYMLIAVMSKMPGNENFEQGIEFANLTMFYLPRPVYVFVMFCYHVNSIMGLMSLIIQSGQVLDYVMVNVYGCAPGLELALIGPRYVCGARLDSVTPFGSSLVLSGSLGLVGLLCAPFAVKNLDDNVALQFIAVFGLTAMSVVWISTLVAEPTFPNPLPTVTRSQSSLIGTVLFNFAFASTLPTWVNAKKSDVSVAWVFGLTMVYVVVVYAAVGIVGGMAYEPFYTTDENLFSKLNGGSSKLAQMTVTAYPMLQNFTSIPVSAIMIRDNLIQSGVSGGVATFIAVGLPWILCIPCYTGSGFDTISEVGGLATSSILNFIVPVVLFVLAGRRGRSGDSVAVA
eukprot:TRINITY_DN3261_c0_g1_i1.p1 TRINITY_DN3261_c0_g1~~TRINITY_DN3261_c0_g1_i1.p1  ORF type:complete len:603 (-),score=104.63 TRINITY_DN3261_c0_g1_i1:190-1827(-)